MEVIKGIEQGSNDWLLLRLGMITASKFKDVMAGGRNGAESKTRRAYLHLLAGEILTGSPADTYKNQHMEWGNETEPQARSMYEFDTGYSVEEVTFIRLDEGSRIGCSPDGLVKGANGLIEIKCPKTSTQIETFLSGKMPACHKAQVQGQMWVSGADWCDFVSFDPRIHGAASYFCKRVERDEEYIKQLSDNCYKFSEELLKIVEVLKNG